MRRRKSELFVLRGACCGLALLAGWCASAAAIEPAELEPILAREIIGGHLALEEVQAYTEAAVPPMPACQTAEAWQAEADRMRAEALEKVVFRGQAAAWRDAQLGVEWMETLEGGPEYVIKKLRYEALPGLWIPALLYEPKALTGKTAVMMAVNGHEREGKAVLNKQLRCINLAKRGMLVLSPEWLGMGQLQGENFHHYRLNQLDLCGTSGVAPFFLAMKRGLDVLLAHENADPLRVAVSGLSGGGWQTIFISSLDTRVTLANPVAGYSSFRTRARNLSDLGDSEQTPVDLGAVADYAQLTGMMAPRPTLLTYNAQDDCCFKADHALPPLLEAAGPIYKLFGREASLRSHINSDPGTHNFDRDNREALYGMLKDHFYADSADFAVTETPFDAEVKKIEELNVELPAGNADLHSLAVAAVESLPKDAALPGDVPAAAFWQDMRRAALNDVLRARTYTVGAEQQGSETVSGVTVTLWRLRMNHSWTVPAVELAPADAKGTVILLGDAGRSQLASQAHQAITAGQRVLAIDPFYFGESKIESHDMLFALLISAVGDRPLGIQASQLAAISRWAKAQYQTDSVSIVSVGPRTSVIALAAAALEQTAIGRVDLHAPLGSLKEVIERNATVEESPELFCFGLLETFDIKQLAALVAPRPLAVYDAGDRARLELAGLKDWYGVLGVQCDPLTP